MTNNIAFIVPVYPPHYKFVNTFVETFKKFQFNKQADLWFIFTNKEENKIFNEFVDTDISAFRTLILNITPEETNSLIKTRGIINAKKFFALNELKEEYEYIIVQDSEAKFIKEANLQEICDRYFKDKILYGNKSYIKGEEIINSCLSHFTNEEKTNENLDLILWLNQLCIYKTSTLDDFFNKTGVLKNLLQLKFADFDYYIYMFYLIFYHNFKIKNLGCKTQWSFAGDYTGTLEFTNKKIKELNFYIATNNVAKYLNDNVFLLMYSDDEMIAPSKHRKNGALYRFLHFYWLKRGK